MIILKFWIKNIKIALVFYLSQKSRYNCRGMDVSSNFAVLLLLLYYTSMIFYLKEWSTQNTTLASWNRHSSNVATEYIFSNEKVSSCHIRLFLFSSIFCSPNPWRHSWQFNCRPSVWLCSPAARMKNSR